MSFSGPVQSSPTRVQAALRATVLRPPLVHVLQPLLPWLRGAQIVSTWDAHVHVEIWRLAKTTYLFSKHRIGRLEVNRNNIWKTPKYLEINSELANTPGVKENFTEHTETWV